MTHPDRGHEIANTAQQPPESAPNKWRKRGAVAIGAVCLWAATVVAVNKAVSPDDCPGVDQETLQTVEQLFDAPKPDDFYWRPDVEGGGKGPYVAEHITERAIAENGLHFFHYSTDADTQKLLDEPDAVTKNLLKSRFEASRVFSSKYGINLRMGGPAEEYFYNGRPYTEAEWQKLGETFDAPNNLIRLMLHLSNEPAELVRMKGLKNIVLAHLDVGGYARLGDDTYYVDIGSGFQEYLFPHEAFHLLDGQVCPESAHNDPQYAALDEGDIYTNKGNYISQDEFQKNKALTDPSKIATDSDYGFSNVVEDKAELGRNITDPYKYGVMLDKRSPVLRNKFLLLMSRIFKKNPNVVRYYAATTPNTADNPISEGLYR